MTETERRDWNQYRATGDVDVRNRLVERHLALVHHFAGRMEPRAAGGFERDDLVSAGVLGLMNAVSAYDPSRGFRFSTFAAQRIRGAMLDEMRRDDVAPRSVRRRERDVARARARLSLEQGRAPRHAELAEAMGIDSATLSQWQWDMDRSQRVSLTEGIMAGVGASEDGASWLSRSTGPDARLSRDQEVARLRRELETLSEREQLILRLYDLESLTLREIAVKLGVTESRVSQLRTRSLKRLRERLGDLREAA